LAKPVNFKPTPSKVPISVIKSKMLRPATTSNYECWFPPPDPVIKWFSQKRNSGFLFDWNETTQQILSFNCVEASLPGSTFATNEINDDYTGVTERIPYRRQYDDRSDFTFIIDNSFDNNNSSHYRVLKFFELWMQYISDESISGGVNDSNYFYRMNYPDDFMAPYIIVDKFEKDFESCLRYRFLNAYPLAVNSIPITYESTQVLKCTVSFSYIRYTIESFRLPGIGRPNTPYSNSNTFTTQGQSGIPATPDPPSSSQLPLRDPGFVPSLPPDPPTT
jgi:hypothetical protein